MGVTSPVRATDSWFVGEDTSLIFTVVDNTTAAKDITGYTISFKLAAAQGSSAVLTKAASLTTPASGICTVSILRADTLGLTPGTYWYELARTDTGSNTVLAYGPAVLLGRAN